MNAAEALAVLERCGALQRGHFRLSSGLHSDVYVQCALVCAHPGIAERLGHELGVRFEGADPTLVLGPAMGGVIIAHETARQLGVPMIFSERVDGQMVLRRGFTIGATDRVLVAEDVVTTGRSQKEAMELATAAGAQVVGVGAIVDRSGGVSFGVAFEALVRMAGERWEPEACPLCRAGREFDSPGSRHLVR